MSAIHRELPESFKAAFEAVRGILSRSRSLVERGLVDPEAERIVAEAYLRTKEKGFTSQLSRVDFYSRMNDRFPLDSAELAVVWATARSEGRLLQHLLGSQVFLSHEYRVSPDVLVPRPETEALVRLAQQKLKSPALGLEIGVGSGVISIELLAHFPGLKMIASEVSGAARAICLENARTVLGMTGAQRLELVAANTPDQVFEPFATAPLADFLISNPPYLAGPEEADPEVHQGEPSQALYAPKGQPLFFYTIIEKGARTRLKPGGMVFLELAAQRADEVLKIFSEGGWKAGLFPDLAGRPRILVARPE